MPVHQDGNSAAERAILKSMMQSIDSIAHATEVGVSCGRCRRPCVATHPPTYSRRCVCKGGHLDLHRRHHHQPLGTQPGPPGLQGNPPLDVLTRHRQAFCGGREEETHRVRHELRTLRKYVDLTDCLSAFLVSACCCRLAKYLTGPFSVTCCASLLGGWTESHWIEIDNVKFGQVLRTLVLCSLMSTPGPSYLGHYLGPYLGPYLGLYLTSFSARSCRPQVRPI